MSVKIPAREICRGDWVLLGRGYGRKPFTVAFDPEVVSGGRVRISYDDGSIGPLTVIVYESDSEVALAWT
jgi:hypothetical protein